MPQRTSGLRRLSGSDLQHHRVEAQGSNRKITLTEFEALDGAMRYRLREVKRFAATLMSKLVSGPVQGWTSPAWLSLALSANCSKALVWGDGLSHPERARIDVRLTYIVPVMIPAPLNAVPIEGTSRVNSQGW